MDLSDRQCINEKEYVYKNMKRLLIGMITALVLAAPSQAQKPQGPVSKAPVRYEIVKEWRKALGDLRKEVATLRKEVDMLKQMARRLRMEKGKEEGNKERSRRGRRGSRGSESKPDMRRRGMPEMRKKGPIKSKKG